jgi:hypothetical protein
MELILNPCWRQTGKSRNVAAILTVPFRNGRLSHAINAKLTSLKSKNMPVKIRGTGVFACSSTVLCG